MAATFDKTQLDEVPTATDMWAVLHLSPGIRVQGYDVGGSHKSQQSRYETFGVRSQNRVLYEGVNTTEGTGSAGGYYDYYAMEEMQVSAQGADVEMSHSGRPDPDYRQERRQRFLRSAERGVEPGRPDR